ncbi:hypothetical protein EV421DRAFT_1736217 [Armillaria borealis]|uniref:Uncharacterized protein n=1 Tax=Armillaria borealis TaxID=47425 RepID=A0AA39MQB4_9AGAR|nr:hypothetical protein EV421DRAFT_1736217 [Armillaria borealis]
MHIEMVYPAEFLDGLPLVSSNAFAVAPQLTQLVISNIRFGVIFPASNLRTVHLAQFATLEEIFKIMSDSPIPCPPELGRKLPELPVPYDECGMIYIFIPDINKEKRCIYSQRIEGDFIQLCFSVTGSESAVELPKTLEEAKAWARSPTTEVPIPEGWYAMLDMLKEVQDTMKCSQTSTIDLDSTRVLESDLRCISIPKDFSKKYFRMHADKIESIWSTTKVIDYAFATTVPVPGEILSEGAWLRWYIKKLTDLSFTDAQAASALWHFLASAGSWTCGHNLESTVWKLCKNVLVAGEKMHTPDLGNTK